MADSIETLIISKLDSLEKRMDDLDGKIGKTMAMANSIGTLAADDASIDENEDGHMTREAVTQITLDGFDFIKCAKTMKFLNWTWVYTEHRIPTVDEIRKTAVHLFTEAWNTLDAAHFNVEGWRESTISTGGLEVWVCEGDYSRGGKRFANLRFIIEEFGYCE